MRDLEHSFIYLFLLVFRDRVSLCLSGCSKPQSVHQAGLELTEIHLPLLPSVLGLKVCYAKELA